MAIREKKHRLPEESYWGQVTVSFDAVMMNRRRFFLSEDRVKPCVEILAAAAEECDSFVPIYCFMPDHLHVLIRGRSPNGRPKQAMDLFKGRTASWFVDNHPNIHWQKDYYDHIIRRRDDWKGHARYVLLNPVLANLVEDPFAYPFTGCIGADLHEVFWDLSDM